ncbi:uncharacterized protein LOC107260814 [Ricinus communis]|uniref:uncharacterized protein LOC107260814 n=1 Tax=Ricinus communis TaxID=3988 RepID=UPI00201A9D6C|nr:uncharacterized protein LOC107260814 [Ricinus communis]
MEIFPKSDRIDLWDIVKESVTLPIKKENSIEVLKTKKEWSLKERKLYSRDRKAMNILYCALSREEYEVIEHCLSAKKIWDSLANKHEGITQVKIKKTKFLVHEYEMFQMKPSEKVSEMYSRLMSIINALKKLGKMYQLEEINNKILRVLPRKEWESKVNSIEEVNNLSTLSTDLLMGKLLTHEMTMTNDQKEIAKEVKEKKKKSIALKVKEVIISDSESDHSDDYDEDLTLIAKKLRNILMKKKKLGKPFKKLDDAKKESIICFSCNKQGHIKADCPKLKKYPKEQKKNELKATWDDSSKSKDDNNSSENEVANLCLIAMEEPTNDEVIDSNSPTYNKLVEMYDITIHKYDKMKLKKKFIENKANELEKLIDELKKETNLLSN